MENNHQNHTPIDREKSAEESALKSSREMGASSFRTLNMPALLRHPRLVSLIKLQQTQINEVGYQVETAKCGDPTLIIKLNDAKTCAFHSRYNPQAEAKRQVDVAITDHSHVLILGMGLGYTLQEALSRLPDTGREHQVIVVEPDPMVFFTALSVRDLRGPLTDRRVDWCIGMTPDEVGETWNTCLDWTSLERLAILEHPPTLSRFPDYFERLKEKIRFLCNRSKGNLITLMHAGHEFHSNYFANMAAMTAFPGVARLFGKFQNVPAIIVAAGPSLEKNVGLLRSVKGKFLIIAVDTSFRQLVTHGIRPDIVCAADPSYLNSLDFVGVEEEMEVVLALELMTHPDILTSFHGQKMLMTFGGGLAPIMESFREPIGKLVSWGSIATTAFDMARKLECDPIVFIGLDLSFQDGRLYARGSYSDDVFYDSVHSFTSLEHETLDYISLKGIHKIEKENGRFLFTDQNMNLYRGWFEDQFRQTRQTVINATEGGVVEKHVQCRPLNEVINEYLHKSAPIKQIISQALETSVKCDFSSLRKKLDEILMDVRAQESVAKTGINLCRKLTKSVGDVLPQDLNGTALADYDEILKLHDKLCENSTLFSWFSIHQTRFITRHTMEIKNLKSNSLATLFAWLTEMTVFFEAAMRFNEYQLPLLENGIRMIFRKTSDGFSQKSVDSDGGR